MPEYIEREALLKDISESVVFTVRSNIPYLEMRGAQKIIDRIKSAPIADVVEVVRCKDCEYSHFIASCSKYMCRKGCGELRFSNDFCSYGKRKEGAGDGNGCL